MNAKLLQKIEELTLYMIDQQRDALSQKQEIGKLKKEVSQLRQQIRK